MTKKLNQLLFDASSMSVSMETTQKIENARSQQPKELEQFFFNEPELTCSYMHLIHLTCLFYMFFEIFKISWFFDDFRPKIWIFDADWYLYET